MARRSTPPGKNRSTQTDGTVETLNISSEGGDDDNEEEEEEEEDEGEMTDAQRRRARGDGVGDEEEEEEEEEEDPDEEEEEEEEDEEEDPEEEDPDEEEEEEEDPDEDEEGEEEDPLDEETLRRVAGSDMIPKARFNQVLRERDELIRAGARGATAVQDDPPPAFDRKAKVKARNAALLDGKEDDAAQLDEEIAEYDRSEARASAAAAIRSELETRDLMKVARVLEKQHPVLRQGTTEYDEETVGDVLALRNRYYQASGGTLSLADSLTKAVNRLLGEKPGKAAGADTRKVKKTVASKEGADNRSIRDKRKALKVARGTPAALGKVGGGNRSAAKDDWGDEGPSEKQMKRMTPKERARARGDFV